MDLLNTDVSGTTNKLLQAILRELVSPQSCNGECECKEDKPQEECCPVCGKPASAFKNRSGFIGHMRFCKP